ncbi:MAG TPA: helix-turn-helix transcriptional regulator [Candidatus Dormibacteraeota bacterium]|jgi:DNA-binding PadR family transcriptional regulator
MGSEASGPRRVTVPTLQILALLLADPGKSDWFGLEVSRQTGLGSGTVTQVLYRLEDWRWVTSRWEDRAEATRQGRPRRRFYELTGEGRQEAKALVRRRFPGLLRLNLEG